MLCYYATMPYAVQEKDRGELETHLGTQKELEARSIIPLSEQVATLRLKGPNLSPFFSEGVF